MKSLIENTKKRHAELVSASVLRNGGTSITQTLKGVQGDGIIINPIK